MRFLAIGRPRLGRHGSEVWHGEYRRGARSTVGIHGQTAEDWMKRSRHLSVEWQARALGQTLHGH